LTNVDPMPTAKQEGIADSGSVANSKPNISRACRHAGLMQIAAVMVSASVARTLEFANAPSVGAMTTAATSRASGSTLMANAGVRPLTPLVASTPTTSVPIQENVRVKTFAPQPRTDTNATRGAYANRHPDEIRSFLNDSSSFPNFSSIPPQDLFPPLESVRHPRQLSDAAPRGATPCPLTIHQKIVAGIRCPFTVYPVHPEERPVAPSGSSTSPLAFPVAP